MKLRGPRGLIATALAALALCAALGGYSRMVYDEEVVISSRNMKKYHPRTLGFLPLRNATKIETANRELRKALYSEIAHLNYDDVDLNEIDAALSDLAIDHSLRMSDLPPTLIREQRLADAMLTGEVVKVSRVWFLLYSHIRVVLQLKLVDWDTQELLYSCEASGRNYQISVPFIMTFPLGMFDWAKGGFSTIWHLREEEMIKTFELFAKRVVENFPSGSHVAKESRLAIHNIQLNIPRSPMLAGDELKLVFQGSPGCRASFKMGSIAQNIPMVEMRPGYYGVKYAIPRGASATYCIVVCKLESDEDTLEVPLPEQPFAVDGTRYSVPAAQRR